jgi:mRNA interferase MazF
MRRGDIILSILPGDYGKPRPTVIVQSDAYNSSHDSIVICPLTSYLTEELEYRIRLLPTVENGLGKESEIMIVGLSQNRSANGSSPQTTCIKS